MSVRVYRYGLRRPHEQGERVRAQMRAAHRYRNTLVEIERARRTAVRSAMSAYGNIGELEAAARSADVVVSDAVRLAKAAKAEARSHSGVSSDQKAALSAARERKRDAVRLLRETRVLLRQDVVLSTEVDRVNELAAELRRNARKHCGVYWGTYLLIEAADEAARKVPLYDGAEPSDPRFMRWAGEGRVGVSIAKGADIAVLDDTKDTRIRIEPGTMPKGADPASKRSAKRRHAVLAMRVGSGDQREPVFARWEMVMHRSLPAGARIKNAAVSLRLVGPREEWSVAITLDTTACAETATRGRGVVGVDLGWRMLNGDIRSAAWDGGDVSGFLALPAELIGQVEKVADLRSIRSKNFDASRAALVAAMPADAPAWLRGATASLGQWKSIDRLTKLALRWRVARFDGDAAAYDALEAWRYNDHHLWCWESEQRTRTLRHRREIYRIFAAKLAREYETLAIENFDLRVFSVRAPVETDASIDTVTRAARVVVSPSELRLSLVNAFGPHRVVKVDAANTTRECSECHHINTWDAAAELSHTCAQCGARWDQDANAARVIRARGTAASPAPGAARNGDSANDSAAPIESRWAKAKRMRAEKRSGEGGARKPVDAAAE